MPKITRNIITNAVVDCLEGAVKQPNRQVRTFKTLIILFCITSAKDTQHSSTWDNVCADDECRDPVEYLNDSVRIHVGSLTQSEWMRVDGMLSSDNDRPKRQAESDMSEVTILGKENEWLYYEDSVSKTYLMAEYSDFDLSDIFTAMSKIQTHLRNYTKARVEELPDNISLSKRYQGWKRLKRTKDTITYGEVRAHMGHAQCYLYCRDHSAHMVRNYNELKLIQRAFNIDLSNNLYTWSKPFENPGFWLDYQFYNGPTLHVVPSEVKPSNYEYTYDSEVYAFNGTNYRKIDGVIRYHGRGQKKAVHFAPRHSFGPMDLRKACSDTYPEDLFVMQNYAKRTSDEGELFGVHRQATPAEAIYMGATKPDSIEDNDDLSCKHMGFKGTPSAIKKGLCACIGVEPTVMAQDVQDSVIDIIMELETHLQHQLVATNSNSSAKIRKKRMAWIAAAKWMPRIASAIWKVQGKSAATDLARDAGLGIAKTFAKTVMRSLNVESVVSRLRYNDASPPRIMTGRGREASGEDHIDQAVVKHRRDNTKVKFFNPYTAVGQGLNISHYVNVETLMRQARRMIRAKDRIFDLIHSGKFVRLKGFKTNDRIVSVAQMTAQIIPDEHEPLHGRHVTTNLIAQQPQRMEKVVALPIERSPSGDMIFYQNGGACEFRVKAKKRDHECERVKGYYEDLRRIRIRGGDIYIVTDRYPNIKIRCDAMTSKYLLNNGLVVFVITGKYRVEFSDSRHESNDETKSASCNYRVIINRSVGRESISPIKELIDTTIKSHGLHVSEIHHGAAYTLIAMAVLAIVFTVILHFHRKNKYKARIHDNKNTIQRMGETVAMVPDNGQHVTDLKTEFVQLTRSFNELKSQIQDTAVVMNHR